MGSIKNWPRPTVPAPANQNVAGTYDELTLRAHRLQRRAALFEISAIAKAASAPEHAAARASLRSRANTG
jgi:hypothetical protein